ncbi:MAG: hypothetical protein Kow00124_26230 [Anaerolineae bacterium]
MGTDIHLFAEYRREGRWVAVGRWHRVTWGQVEGFDLDDEPLYGDRNYRLFAMLADVRNGYGFAGVDTGEPLTPIAPPRGLPPDVSPEVASQAAIWDADGHSHSWLTLAELLAYDWTQVATLRGIVDAGTYLEWANYGRRRGESPRMWSGMVFMPGAEIVSEEEMDRRIAAVTAGIEGWWEQREAVREKLENVFCRVSWQQPYYRLASKFWVEVIPRLLRCGPPPDVRIVFWFDN